ncbi:MAG: DUF302 domain-containing protein [Gammaproteobacteria bacterium]|nr:DUF302 domain-containing protein [Gammaproteobacteria bacterium]MDJ0891412.1 DUF302 domain-containing protein [Gammaproteobacteria bacterium]
MRRFVILTLAIGFALSAASAWSEGQDAPVVVYPADSDFEDVIENIKMAVEDRGMLVSGTLHVQDMLTRTAKDLGFDKNIYLHAESVEFCSAVMSHQMVAADPRNLVICPFTIAAYELAAEPGRVYIAYRKQFLAGDADEATSAVIRMLDEIAREAAE